jgi:hypothetical protein
VPGWAVPQVARNSVEGFFADFSLNETRLGFRSNAHAATSTPTRLTFSMTETPGPI